MKCNYCIEDIIKYTENVLSEEAKAELKKHIENCESCKKAYTALLLTEKFSNSTATMDENFHLDIIKKLDSNRYSKKNLVFYKIQSKLKPAISIAACLAIIFTAFTFRQRIYDFTLNSYNSLTRNTDIVKKLDIVETDNINVNELSNTAVINPCFGKKGPGEEYDSVIELPYGRVISLLGRHKENYFWFLATLTPATGEKSTDTLFWVNIDNISMDGLYTVTFNNCNSSYASMFNNVIVNVPDQALESLRLLPDDKSDMVCYVKNGDLINVLKEDEEWSLVRKLTDKDGNFSSYTGWIHNNSFTYCKPGMDTNQGFLRKISIVYESPNESSPVSNHFAVKDLLAPVVIDSVEGEWTKISIGIDEYMGIYPLYSALGLNKPSFEWGNISFSTESLPSGWVKTEELITSFEDVDLFALTNPEIDKADLANKIKSEISNWDNLTLNAYDIGRTLTLTNSQKSILAEKLTYIEDIEFFDGGILYEREAIYPFYFLELKSSSAPELGSYEFAVAGEDRLVIKIPYERYDYYDYLNHERIPVRFIKVNKEFIEYIKSLIPTPANDDINDINYLLDAKKVLVTNEAFSQPEEGIGPQVYKCARVIKDFMGNEINPENVNKSKEHTVFNFIFEDSSSVEIVITEQYIKYNDKYYTLKEPAENIIGRLFAGYF